MRYLIYKITNNVNGKIYIGKHHTDNINDGYFGSGKLIKQAIKKYGIENFTFHLMFELQNEEEMNLLEKIVVNQDFLKRDDVYNLKEGGEGGCCSGENNPWFGKHFSEEHKMKIGEAHKGKVQTQGTRDKIRIALTNKPLSNEHKMKIGEAHLGLHHTKETRRKISESTSGYNNPFFGKKHSQKTLSKIRAAHIGKHWYNNGNISKFFNDNEVQEGFEKGRLTRGVIWVNNGIREKMVDSDNIPNGFVNGKLKRIKS